MGLIGLAAVILGTLLTAPLGRGPGEGWWNLIASGAVLSVIGALVALPSEGVGGLLALVGGVAPSRERPRLPARRGGASTPSALRPAQRSRRYARRITPFRIRWGWSPTSIRATSRPFLNDSTETTSSPATETKQCLPSALDCDQ